MCCREIGIYTQWAHTENGTVMTDPTDLELAHLLTIATSAAGYDVTNDMRYEKDFASLEAAVLVDVSREHDTMSNLRCVLVTHKGLAVAEAMLNAGRLALLLAEGPRDQ